MNYGPKVLELPCKESCVNDIQLHTFKPGIKGGAWAKIRSFNQCANVTEQMVKLIIEEISMLFNKAQPSYHSAKPFYTSLHMCVCAWVDDMYRAHV